VIIIPSYVLSEFYKVILRNYFKSTTTLSRKLRIYAAAFQITYYYLTIELFNHV